MIRGDFGKLAGLAAKLRAASGGKVYEALKKNLAAEALTQMQLGFRGSRDPYGQVWRPLKKRRGKPLLDTGRLRGSFSYQVTSTGFRLGTVTVYAAAHQYGTRRIRARPMLPTGQLGPIWSKAFNEAGRTTLRKFMR